MQKQHIRTCEKVTQDRAKDLAENGARCAIDAKLKGKTKHDWRGYCTLLGDNNTQAWVAGWNKEWDK